MKKYHETVGEYYPADEENGKEQIIKREAYGQGFIYKNWINFYENKDEVCYIPELTDQTYTATEILNLCAGDAVFAKDLFEHLDWQHAESLLEDWCVNGEIVECPNCRKLIDQSENEFEVCPYCGYVQVKDE